MDHKSTRQLMLIRYYLSLAQGQSLSGGEPARFTTINLLHEAFESTLIACSDHLNLSLPDRTTIEQYLTKINTAVGEGKLPYRSRLLQFNRARVSAKHALTLPDDAMFKLSLTVVPEFVRAAVLLVFEVELESVHLHNLVHEDNVRAHLTASSQALSEGRYFDSLAESRKSIYIVFERDYDLSVFEGTVDGERYGFLDPRSMNRSPYFAESARYVAENVKCPTDYIVLDHSRLDNDLVKDGIDTHLYWNVRRLTPAVWQRSDKTWRVDYELDIAESASLKLDVEYCLDRATSMILQRQTRRSVERYKSSILRSVEVQLNAPILARASADSEITGHLPDGVNRVNVTSATQGLDSDDWYWNFFYIEKGGPYLGGFIKATDAGSDLQDGINYLQDREKAPPSPFPPQNSEDLGDTNI